LEVPVLRDPLPDEVRARLMDGPLVVVGAGAAVLTALVSSRAPHGWACLPAGAEPAVIDIARRAAEAGLVVLPASNAHALGREPGPRSGERWTDLEEVESLTPREREVLQHVVQGLHNRAIAANLGISDHTVKFHLASIFGKLGVSTRTEAVRVGLRRGLVQI
jgi:DNA-binding NarL/FixJ family response regulator